MINFFLQQIKHVISIVVVFAVLCCLSMAGHAQSQEEEGGRSDTLLHILNNRTNDLQEVLDEANELQNNARELAQPLAQNLQTIQTEITRLLSLFQASRSHPTEQLTLLRQMKGLQQELKNSMQPLQNIALDIEQRLTDVEQLRKDIDDFAALNRQEGLNSGSLSQEEQDKQGAYIKGLDKAKSQLSKIHQQINKLLVPVKTTYERLETAIKDIDGSLLDIWRNYYFTAAGGNLDTLAASPAAVRSWLKSLGMRMALAYPQTFTEWVSAASTFLVSFIIMALAGLAGLSGAKKLPPRWRHGVEDIVKKAWIWVAMGCSILIASTNQLGGIYFSFLIVGVLLLVWGVASFSWRLRVTAHPKLQGYPSPLARLYLPAALGVVMLFSDLPPKVLIVVWAVIMVTFVIWVRSINRRNEKDHTALLERMAYGCAFYFGIISFLICVAGYARMAILAFMLLFAIINTLILGNALTALGSLLCDRLFPKHDKPLKNAILRALAIPAGWIVSLLCAVPWLWAVPGATYILNYFMNTNYNIGEASFDLSRVFIIAMLFFLFRSFVSLSKTSFDHLPSKIPHMEKGVIPPLRNLVSYLLWIIFIIIVLGMLGVNFTSLAVVAGGLSVGIGLGMQNIFNNLVSGLMLIFGRTILVGDYVEVGAVAGTVKSINIRSTVIETPDKSEVFIPNSTLMAGQFINWTRSQRAVRRTVKVGVAYGSDVKLVMQILMDLAHKQPHVLSEPAPIVQFSDFGNSTLDFSLMVFVDDLLNGGPVLTDLRVEIERSFRENNIEIAFPQLDVHLHGSAGAQELRA